MAQPRSLLRPVLLLGGAALLGLAVLAAAGFAVTTLLTAVSHQPSGTPSSGSPPVEVPAARPALDEEPPAAAPDAPPPPGTEFVRVANTGGTGAFIRDEPRSNARGIVAHTDRTVLKIVGADVTAEGRPWRNVEDQRGNRGWTPAQYLVPSDVGF